MHSLRSRNRFLALALPIVAAVVVCCSASIAAANVRTAESVSGTWKGSYAGTFHGTFTLHWTQTRSVLKGTINLSPGGRSPINGSVNGAKINFGTVGSTVITYKGTVSGKSMSGTYHTPSGGGTWHARKT